MTPTEWTTFECDKDFFCPKCGAEAKPLQSNRGGFISLCSAASCRWIHIMSLRGKDVRI